MKKFLFIFASLIFYINIFSMPLGGSMLSQQLLNKKLERIKTFMDPKKRKRHYKKQARKNAQKIIKNVCYHQMHLMF